MKKKKEKISKTDFVKQLANMTKEEMHDYIKQNGKPPKLITLYHIMSGSKVSK